MTHIKRIITSLLMAALLICCLTSIPALRLEAEAASKSDLTFTLNSAGDGYVVSDCNETASGALVIPSTYNGLPVKAIGSEAFFFCRKLTSISIPETVTSIDSFAFEQCTSLVSISIPNSITSIGEYAFSGCSSLKYKTYKNANYLGNNENPYCVLIKAVSTSITSCTIHPDTKIIYREAFARCSSLTSITIPDNVISIDEAAFSRCSGLTKVTISDSVTSIGPSAFFGCSALTRIVIPDSVVSIGSYAFHRCSALTDVSLPANIISIGGGVFAECTSLKYSTYDNAEYLGNDGNPYLVLLNAVSDSITSCAIHPDTKIICQESFRDCSSLTSISIPDGVASIGYRAFYECSGLTSITIPDSVTSIGDHAFNKCSGLTSITIPDGVTSIGDGTFYYCPGLTSVTIPNSVTSIGNYAFYYCSGLTSVTIPDSVTSIGTGAFELCINLTRVDIGNGVTSLGSYPFNSCLKLVSIQVKEDNPVYHSMGNCIIETNSKTLVVGCKNSKIPDDDSVISIGPNAFDRCYSLTSITIPNNITCIEKSAFADCSGLTSIAFPDSVTVIGPSAFFRCRSINKLYFNGSSPEIGSGAFFDIGATAYYHPDETWTGDVMQDYGGNITWVTAKKPNQDDLIFTLNGSGDGYIVSGYKNTIIGPLVIPATYNGLPVEAIGDNAFYGCPDLTNVTIGNNIISIGRAAFADCSALTSVTIDSNIKTIGDYAFYRCTNLNSVTIPDSITNIGSAAFFDCTNLKYNTYDNALYLGNNVNPHLVLINAASTSIDSCVIHSNTKIICPNAFSFCTGLTSITIPYSVTSIDSYAFSYCTGVTEIFFKGSAPDIRSGTFERVTATAFYYPDDSWTEKVMQGYGGNITWVAREKLGQSVTISYTAFGNASDPITIELFPEGSQKAAYTFTNAATPANSGTWSIEGVAEGVYTVRVMKKNHVTREYSLAVGDESVTLDVEIWLLGDVSGDGRVNFADYSKVLAQAKAQGSLQGYSFQCADVNGDGRINFSDYSKVLSQAKGNHTLW